MLQKSRSRPPSFAGGDSPVLRSRSSTCDSIQSGSSPIANCPNRQFTLTSHPPSYNPSASTSPKQHLTGGVGAGAGQYLGGTSGGGSSPISTSSQSGRGAVRNVAGGDVTHITGARKSTSAGNVHLKLISTYERF